MNAKTIAQCAVLCLVFFWLPLFYFIARLS